MAAGLPMSACSGRKLLIVSTGLAFCSSYLFSWGVRQAITLHLNGEGMSLSDFISSVKVSGASAVRDRQKLKLTALSIAVFVMAGQQISGWNTLLTPQVFDPNLPGFDVGQISLSTLVLLESSPHLALPRRTSESEIAEDSAVSLEAIEGADSFPWSKESSIIVIFSRADGLGLGISWKLWSPCPT
ncbi:hypothetical protein B0H14DRAFT_2594542 [Mycena olivaceomarginata]|nr:hypothetical protein B0H14DRAFT_2594542 [Mycena olivaceomarginata]